MRMATILVSDLDLRKMNISNIKDTLKYYV
jgi:hypothetical protein